MKPGTRILIATAVVLVTVAMYAATSLRAIGPTVMIFYGEPLKKQVVVSGRDVALFGDMTQPLAATQTTGRTFITVALFWGSASNPAGNGVPVAELTPAMAWQHGRYYPATAAEPAAIMTTTMTKAMAQPPPDANRGAAPFVWGGPVPAEALALLKRLGIPTGPAR